MNLEDIVVRYDGKSMLLFLDASTKEVLFVQKFLPGVVGEFNLGTVLAMVKAK